MKIDAIFISHMHGIIIWVYLPLLIHLCWQLVKKPCVCLLLPKWKA